MKSLIYLSVFFLLILSACEKDEEDEVAPPTYYEGMLIVDSVEHTIRMKFEEIEGGGYGYGNSAVSDWIQLTISSSDSIANGRYDAFYIYDDYSLEEDSTYVGWKLSSTRGVNSYKFFWPSYGTKISGTLRSVLGRGNSTGTFEVYLQ